MHFIQDGFFGFGHPLGLSLSIAIANALHVTIEQSVVGMLNQFMQKQGPEEPSGLQARYSYANSFAIPSTTPT